MKKTFTLLFTAVLITQYLYSQNIFPAIGAAGIGTTTPSASSLLEINSTTKGFLPPRMTLAQRNAIVTPAAGLLIYQTNSTPGLYYYSGAAWVAVSTKAANTSLSNLKGPTAINASLLPVAVDSIDIGSVVLPMRRAWFSRDATINGITIGTGGGSISFNTALGSGALFANTTGSSNTATGFNALRNNSTGYYNAASGSGALAANTNGYFNTATGAASLASNTIGYNNTANGYSALFQNTTGNANTANGNQALYLNTTGNNNTANGYRSLYSNTTGSWNAAHGDEALYANTTGYFNTANGFYALNKNTTGDRNVAAGSYTMFNNTTGAKNTANGVDALLSNTTGSSNTADGFEALHGNTTGFANVAVGVGSLYSNTTPSWIVAVGDSALFHNGAGVVTGDQGVINTATGSHALFYNTTGSYNTANGSASLFSNTTGLVNTALGAFALFGVGTGWQNVGVGYYAGPVTDLTNTISVGAYAHATASNSVQLGDNNITSVKAGNNIIIVSDRRFKKNVKENVPGLDFINQLKPITYNYDIHKLNDYIKPVNNGKYVPGEPGELKKLNEDAIANKEKKIYTGFIAQDVEIVADKMGYDFSGVYKPQNDRDPYGLSYAEFVVPLVKAVQELSKQNDDLKTKSEAQKKINSDLQKQINDLKLMISSATFSTAIVAEEKTFGNSSIHVSPNPTSSQLLISGLSKGAANFIELTDMNGRSLVKQKVTADTETMQVGKFAAGIYLLSYFDGCKLQQVKVVKD